MLQLNRNSVGVRYNSDRQQTGNKSREKNPVTSINQGDLLFFLMARIGASRICAGVPHFIGPFYFVVGNFFETRALLCFFGENRGAGSDRVDTGQGRGRPTISRRRLLWLAKISERTPNVGRRRLLFSPMPKRNIPVWGRLSRRSPRWRPQKKKRDSYRTKKKKV